MSKNNLSASILITNFNKDRYLNRCIKSCISQTLIKKTEILVFDDCSTDNSLNILKKYQNKILYIKNSKKKYTSAPLNQIFGIRKLFKKSKGNIIFLLDSDDYFKINKIKIIYQLFKKNPKLKFVQDVPFLKKDNKLMKLKKKNSNYSIWPSFYPTSCIAIKRDFFMNFTKNLKSNKFPNLEIDARLSIYAFLTKNFYVSKKNLTIYNFDPSGITSKYKKFSLAWWKKRNEAFKYMIFLMKKMKIKFKPSFDFYLTKFINYFI